MNGRITIRLSGVSTPLTFGMMAVEEFGNRQAIGNASWSKLMSDLIYSGYVNEEIVSGRNPTLNYREISEGVDDLSLNEDPILGQVFKCFEDSKAGSKLLGSVKKKDEALEKPKVKKPTGRKSKGLPSGN